MATQNLYEVPDVISALLTAITSHDVKLQQLTLRELVNSGYDPTSILILGWLLSPPEPQHSKACYLGFLSGDLQTAVHQLPAYELPPLPPDPPQPPPPRDTHHVATWDLPSDWSPNTKSRFEQAVRYALKAKNHRHAAYLTSALPVSYTSALLARLGIEKQYINLFETTEFNPLRYRIIEHAYAALAYEGTPSVKKQLPVTSKGRCFKIPTAAYELWSVKPKPRSRLIGIPVHITDLDATPFWKAQVKKYRISRKDNELHFPDDDTLEQFYEQNFPNDIPDEWSNEEREKSHPMCTIRPSTNVWIPALALS